MDIQISIPTPKTLPPKRIRLVTINYEIWTRSIHASFAIDQIFLSERIRLSDPPLRKNSSIRPRSNGHAYLKLAFRLSIFGSNQSHECYGLIGGSPNPKIPPLLLIALFLPPLGKSPASFSFPIRELIGSEWKIQLPHIDVTRYILKEIWEKSQRRSYLNVFDSNVQWSIQIWIWIILDAEFDGQIAVEKLSIRAFSSVGLNEASGKYFCLAFPFLAGQKSTNKLTPERKTGRALQKRSDSGRSFEEASVSAAQPCRGNLGLRLQDG